MNTMKMNMKVDYYKFECRIPYRLEEVHGTLKEAKSAYLERLNQGYRLGCDIYGCIEKEDCVLVTFTHFFSNTKTFGRTYLTNIGHSIKKGTYIL